MKNAKNIGIIIISLIITLLTTAVLTNKVFGKDYTQNGYITEFDFEKWVIGGKMGLNVAGYSTTTSKFAKGFQVYQNFNFFCAERGQATHTGEFTIDAIVKINANNTVTATNSNGSVTIPSTDSSDSAALKANWIFKQIAYEAEQYEAKGSTDLRKRIWVDNGEVNYDLRMDAYQCAVWVNINDWAKAVFGDEIIASNEFDISKYVGGNKSGNFGWRYDDGIEIIETIKTNADKNNGIIVDDVIIENNKDTTSLETKEIIDKYSVLGPFSYTYKGTVETVNIYFNDDQNDIPSEINFIQYNGTTQNTIENVPNGEEFYIKIPTQDIEEKEKINININVKGAKQISATIYFLISGNSADQTIMYIKPEVEEQEDSITNSYTLTKQKEITIQKQDASGNELKVPGIKFSIYNSSNVYVGSLETDENGKTNSIKLGINQEYTIKEMKNNLYGYKGCTITDAKIVSGDGTISVSNGEAKVKITEDTVISIENKPELGTLTIDKKGNNDKNLEGVEFAIWKGNAYLKLNEESVTTPIVTSNEGIDITEYNVTTVTKVEEATKFKTNSSGKIVINNLEIYSGKGEKYSYWVYEKSNDNHGYKDVTIGEVKITGGIALDREGYEDWAHFEISENTTVTIANIQKLSDVEIEKIGENGIKLENVQFIVQRDKNEYLQLKNVEGKAEPEKKGTVIINSDNIANETEYRIEYVSDKDSATKFITDSDGKVTIKNLEVNKSAASEYSYTAYEIHNPNYGYGSTANTSLSKEVKLVLNETAQIKMDNAINLGNLKLEKILAGNPNVKLENVGFVIEIIPSIEKVHTYLALYNKDGKIEPSVKGTATINRQNIATADGKEYEVRYYYTDKVISELSDEEKANITTFITQSDGTLTVNNLEVYSSAKKDKYEYKLVETYNPNYGFVANWTEIGNVIIENNETTEVVVENIHAYRKLSGYVWVENSSGKSNEYDGIYTEGNSSSDIKLTDLYVMKDGKLIKNPEAVVPVEIKLRDKTTGEFIKTIPDEFDENGKYTFTNIEVVKLENYEVVFVYDGFYYTTVVEQLDKDNGSKVKEVASERDDLSNKFATVKDNSEVVSTDGTINTVEYYKDGHTSTVSKLNFDTTVSANTTQTDYNLKTAFDNQKTNGTELKEELYNVNMGLVLREQPKISINSDIYSVLVDFEGYKYNYKYNGRQNYYENVNGDDIGVKFEQENAEKRYTRTVYASDVQAAKDLGKEIRVAVTYKIQIANQSRTLSVMTKQLINYFDARYDIKAVGLGLDQTTHTIINTLEFSQAQNVEGHPEYKSVVIDFNQISGVDESKIKDLYITFDIQKDAIFDLLNEKSTYHNATEIISYASYYGNATAMLDGKQFMTDQTEVGKIYAGIDKMSQPGNMEIQLVDYSSGDGTKVLDTTNYEDDTTSAPALLLEAGPTRKVSGTVFEDKATAESEAKNEKLGNGIFEQGEKAIQNVKVGLYKVNEDGSIGDISTYSNGEQAITTTNDKGEYTFGYYDEANKKHVGILPGKYVIKYTYNNESYIVGKEAINVNDYKSTIITSEVIKNAFNGQNARWYLIQENDRYSDARDDINLRNSIDVESIKYSNYANTASANYIMNANTPVMDIGIEFTETDEADALTIELIRELKNIDFGIIERPNIDISIEKKITELDITAQNGTSIIPKGNPSDPNEKMQYVKKLDGLVSAEIEEGLLQGAKLNLEYTITIKNNSEIDYEEEEYYFYGTGGNTVRNVEIKKVADYFEGTMVIDKERTQESGNEWQEKTADDLYNEGLISKDVYDELKSKDYAVLITEQFNEVQTGEEESMKLYATKYLAISDAIQEKNAVEIIELSGGRSVKGSIPGNYVPSEQPNEPDEDRVDLIITPPTGTTVDYMTYIIAATVTSIILVLGIVIIKKKIIK